MRENTLQYLNERRENVIQGYVNCIPSPFERFKDAFIGIEQGSYMAITSYTKGGKTQFALNLLFNALIYAIEHPDSLRLKIFYFCLEETAQKIYIRFMCWILYRLDKIRVSPRDLKSSTNIPIDERILNLLKEEKYKKYFDAFEEVFQFSNTANPTGIYKECKAYAEQNGTVHTKKVSFSEVPVFDRYESNDPHEYRVVVIDHISLIDQERGFTKKEAIDKLSEYLSMTLRNRYNFSPIVIQQQSTENESADNVKLSRIRPSGAGLSDSKYIQRDVDTLLGLFSPYKFGLKEYMGYDITILKDHIRFLEVLASREGTVGSIIALYFDGATCTFMELPKPEEMKDLYARMKAKPSLIIKKPNWPWFKRPVHT